MVISGMSSVGAGTSMGAMGMNQTSDPVSKDLLRQIDEAKKKLQELSSDDNMSMEERVKDKSFTPRSLCLRCIHKLFHAQKTAQK